MSGGPPPPLPVRTNNEDGPSASNTTTTSTNNNIHPRGRPAGPPGPGRRNRKRPRPRISLADIQIIAPPERQFQKPTPANHSSIRSEEGSRPSGVPVADNTFVPPPPLPTPPPPVVNDDALLPLDLTRAPSWDDLSKAAADSTTAENNIVESSSSTAPEPDNRLPSSGQKATETTATSKDNTTAAKTSDSNPAASAKARLETTKSSKTSTTTDARAKLSTPRAVAVAVVEDEVMTDAGYRDSSGNDDGRQSKRRKHQQQQQQHSIEDDENNNNNNNNTVIATTTRKQTQEDVRCREREVSIAEEEELLDWLDRKILRAEEEDILRRLELSIQRAEAQEEEAAAAAAASKRPTMVSPTESLTTPDRAEPPDEVSEQEPQITNNKNHNNSRSTHQENATRPSRQLADDDDAMKRVARARREVNLPRWMPQMGESSESATKSPQSTEARRTPNRTTQQQSGSLATTTGIGIGTAASASASAAIATMAVGPTTSRPGRLSGPNIESSKTRGTPSPIAPKQVRRKFSLGNLKTTGGESSPESATLPGSTDIIRGAHRGHDDEDASSDTTNMNGGRDSDRTQIWRTTFLRKPKILHGGINFSEEEFHSDFLNPFLKTQAQSRLRGFEFSLRTNPTKYHLYDFEAKGQEEFISELTKKVRQWASYRGKMAKLNCLMGDDKSQVVDIIASPDQYLGITFGDWGQHLLEKQRVSNDGAIVFEVSDINGLIPRKFGQGATKPIAAIIAADGTIFHDSAVLQEYLVQKRKDRSFVKLTLCFHRDTDLSRGFGAMPTIRPLRDEERPALTSNLPRVAGVNTEERPQSPTTTSTDDEFLDYAPPDFVNTSAIPQLAPKTKKDVRVAMTRLLEDERTVELDLWMPVAAELGARLYYVLDHGWIGDIEPEGSLGSALGKEFGKFGFIVAAINDTKVKTPDEFKQVKSNLQNADYYKLCGLCYDGVDLSGADRSRLVRPPRRRNGAKYPLHLYPKPNATAATSSERAKRPASSGTSPSNRDEMDQITGGAERRGTPSIKRPRRTADPSMPEAPTANEDSANRPNLAIETRPRQSENSMSSTNDSQWGAERSPLKTTTVTMLCKLKSFGGQEVFSPDTFDRDFMPVFKRELKEMLPSKFDTLDIAVRYANRKPFLVEIRASGDPKAVTLFKKKVSAWGKYVVKVAKLDLILNDPDSIVVDIKASYKDNLGVRFIDAGQISPEHIVNYHGGVWFELLASSGAVARLLGSNACKAAAAIIAVDGISSFSNSRELERLLAQMWKERTTCVITICLYKQTQLLNPQDRRLNLRRLSQTNYYLQRSQVASFVAAGQDNNAVMEYPPSDFVSISALPESPPRTDTEVQQAANKIMSDEKSVEVEFLFRSNDMVGARICDVVGAACFLRFLPGGSLASAFGKDPGGFAVVVSLNDAQIREKADFFAEKEKATTQDPFRLRVACFDGVDLSCVDRSRLVGSPRRRNGDKYPMHLHPKERSSDATIVASNAKRAPAPVFEEQNILRENAGANVIVPQSAAIQAATREDTAQNTDFSLASSASPPTKKARVDDSDGKIRASLAELTISSLPADSGEQLIEGPTRLQGNPEPSGRVALAEIQSASDCAEADEQLESGQQPMPIFQKPADDGMETEPKEVSQKIPKRLKQFVSRVIADEISSGAEISFETDFMEDFRQEMARKDQWTINSFKYTVATASDPDWFELRAEGDAKIIDILTKRIGAWRTFVSKMVTLDVMLGDPQSVVVDVRIPADQKSLGISYRRPQNLSREHLRQWNEDCDGVMFEISHPSGVIPQALGKDVCRHAAAIIAVDGSFPCRNSTDMKTLLKQKRGDAVITICIFKRTWIKNFQNPDLNVRRLGKTRFYHLLKDLSKRKQTHSSAIPAEHVIPPTRESAVNHPISEALRDLPGDERYKKTGPSQSQRVGINGEKKLEESSSAVEKQKIADVARDLTIANQPNESNTMNQTLGGDGEEASNNTTDAEVAQASARADSALPPKALVPTSDESTTDFFPLSRPIPKKKTSVSNDTSSFLSANHMTLNSNEARRDENEGDNHSPPYDDGDDLQGLQALGRRNAPSFKSIDRTSAPGQKRRTMSLSAVTPTAAKPTNASRPNLALSAKSETFEQSFDATRPLGAFFVTVTNDIFKTCKVQSRWISGQTANNTRIRPGTIVEFVIIGKSRKRVRGHRELCKFFEEAARARSRLILVFKNLDSITEVENSVDKDWTFDGKWQGEKLDGWAGGSELSTDKKHSEKGFAAFHPPLQKQMSAGNDLYAAGLLSRASSPTPKLHGETYHDQGNSVASLSSPKNNKSIHSGPAVGDEIVMETKQETPGKEPLARKRSITFGPTTAVIIPALQSGTSTKPTESGAPAVAVFDLTESDDEEAPAPQLNTHLSKLQDAVRKKTCKELIEVLEGGASRDAAVIDHGLRECYEEVKRRISSNNNETAGSNRTANDPDLAAKKTVLNIYFNSLLNLERVFSLQNLAWFELRVLNMDLRLTDDSMMPGYWLVYGRIQIRAGPKTELLANLKTQELRNFVIFEENDTPKVKVTNNSHVLMEPRRHLEVDFRKAEKNGSGSNHANLCRFDISLDEIERECPTYDPVSIEIPVGPNSEIRSGELTIEVKRVRTDREYVNRKSHEAAEGLSVQLDNISRFNEGSHRLKLDPNIGGRKGRTMVHAAVHLKNIALLKKLAGLGAKASTDNSEEVESPLTQAKNMRDRATEKLQKLEASGGDPNAISALKDLRSEVEVIVDSLTKMAVSSKDSGGQR